MISIRNKDITGKKFGELTAIKIVGQDNFKNNKWLCECSCGKTKVVGRPNLVRGQTSSCGCKRKEFHRNKTLRDIKGKTFGFLTVIEYSHSDKHAPKWKVKCICGKEKLMYGNNILRSKSCGCNGKTPVDVMKRKVYINYRITAKRRKLKFNISEEKFYKLIQKNCYYCKSEPKNLQKYKNQKFYYNGLDRIDSNKGYIKDNIKTCCAICNRAKHELGIKIFLNWIKQLKENL